MKFKLGIGTLLVVSLSLTSAVKKFNGVTKTKEIREEVSHFYPTATKCQASKKLFTGASSASPGYKNIDHIIELQVLLWSYHSLSGAQSSPNSKVEAKMYDWINDKATNTWPIRRNINQTKKNIFNKAISEYYSSIGTGCKSDFSGPKKADASYGKAVKPFVKLLRDALKSHYSAADANSIAAEIESASKSALAKMDTKCKAEGSFTVGDKNYCKAWIRNIKEDILNI